MIYRNLIRIDKMTCAVLLVLSSLFVMVAEVKAEVVNQKSKLGTHLVNYGDPNFHILKEKWNRLKHDKRSESILRIVQLGDSHTAADILTGDLRSLIQNQVGNAGIGFIAPMHVPGQRHALVKYKAKNWSLKSSRSDSDQDFPMGGYIATPTEESATITLEYHDNVPNDPQYITLLIKQNIKNQGLILTDSKGEEFKIKNSKLGSWKHLKIATPISLPFTLTAEQKDSISLGGIWLENGHKGVILSPIATNGAVQSIWSRWSERWFEDLVATRPDLVIIAYGTNESFETQFDPDLFKRSLIDGIDQIRSVLPKVTILIVGAPDSRLRKQLKNGSYQIQPPPSLKLVRKLQREISKEKRVLYWDWSEAMGGSGSIQDWARSGQARTGLVHLTFSGYKKSAEMLFHDLNQLLDRKTK